LLDILIEAGQQGTVTGEGMKWRTGMKKNRQKEKHTENIVNQSQTTRQHFRRV